MGLASFLTLDWIYGGDISSGNDAGSRRSARIRRTALLTRSCMRAHARTRVCVRV